MADLATIPGLRALWAETAGAPEVCIAVLDGRVDLDHPAFAGAAVEPAAGYPSSGGPPGTMTAHGTHVASILFGSHDGPVPGVAPGCRGLLVPVFADGGRMAQIDLARGIETAVEAGAHLINISGGELTECGEAEDWLDRAVALCRERGVLIVAAAGNDGCDCLHVPAAIPSVLAVGALGNGGRPLAASNWGHAYAGQGVLAPGEDIPGALPGGGVGPRTGTSFATPIVTGVAGLLLSLQARRGEPLDPYFVRDVILRTAAPCEEAREGECIRFLSGTLNITGAHRAMSEEREQQTTEGGCGCQGVAAAAGSMAERLTAAPAAAGMPGVVASESPAEPAYAGKVYALGTLGYDFGTEARRDSFKQLMPPVEIEGTVVPANPYDARQMADYLADNPSEARSLIWTLNLELTPIYAIEPGGPFARDVYDRLQQFLAAQVEAETADAYVERISLPGLLTGRTEKLFSGQTVPVIRPENLRGMYGWRINALVAAAVEEVRRRNEAADAESVRRSLAGFLSRVYFDLRNLGATSRDRALNFAATNAFQAAVTFAEVVAAAMELDDIEVERSPYCRADSDCWDVKLRFFDPENSRRARRVFRFTIDVSDIVPVTMGEVRSWSEAG